MSSAVQNSSSSSPTGDGITKRKSGTAACVHCHRRKVRCDARFVGLPCSNCRSSGKSDCRIHEKRKRLAVRSILDPVPIRCRPPPTANISPAKSVPDVSASSQSASVSAPSISAPHSNSAIDKKSTPVQNNNIVPPNHHVPQPPVGASQSYHPALPPQPSQSQAPQSPLPDSQPPYSSSGQNAHTDYEKRLVNLLDDEEPGGREIQRGVRAIYVGHDVSNMSFLIRQQRDKDDDVYHFAGQDLPRRPLQAGHDQLLMDALTLPEHALADELVQAYFEQVNPGYPIVDEDLFMTQYRSRDPSDPPPVVLLQAILLVGAHVTRPKVERDALKDIFFRRCRWLFDSRIERNRDILVQAALLMTWYSDGADDDVSANAHYWVGIAARIATGIGMHRNTVSSKFAHRDRRMWRRLWYILIQFDVMVSLSYGRPQAINLEDHDVSPLIPSDFKDCGSRVQIEYVIYFTELCIMISYITRERFGLRVAPERRKAVLNEADEALARWSLELPDTLRLRASDMDPWSAMLHLTYNNFLILLHRPHPRASAYSDDYGPHDAEICSAAASVIASIFEELRLNSRLKYLWYSGVHTLFTAMIQVRVELRFSNPVLAINALRRFDSASYSLRELAEYWSHAGTIMRLFENSKRLQEDLRLATSERPRKFSGAEDWAKRTHTRSSSDATTDTTTTTTTATNNNNTGTSAATFQRALEADNSQTNYEIPAPESSQIQDATVLAPHHNSFLDGWIPIHMRLNPSPLARSESVATGTNIPSSVDAVDHQREYLDWRQLFSSNDPDQPVSIPMDGLPELEDEWRQIYWQETPMTDLLQEGGWMQV